MVNITVYGGVRLPEYLSGMGSISLSHSLHQNPSSPELGRLHYPWEDPRLFMYLAILGKVVQNTTLKKCRPKSCKPRIDSA